MDLPRCCVILTGAIGSGKTRALGGIMEALAAQGRRVAAILQPDEGRRPDGAAMGFAMEFRTWAEGRLSVERVALARELKPGELPAAAQLALGRFVFERTAFSRAGDFVRSALGQGLGAEVLGLDEIGRLETQRGEGLMDCLGLALEAAAKIASGGPRVVCSAREDCVVELRRMAQEAGLRTETFEVHRADEALRALRRDLDT